MDFFSSTNVIFNDIKKTHILQNEKKIGDIIKIYFLQFWGIFIFLLVIKDIVSMTENSAF